MQMQMQLFKIKVSRKIITRANYYGEFKLRGEEGERERRRTK